ncbi:MAG: 4-hydroxy-tetrahydrodipicolinate reductase [Candidatus Omnitrophica bacterium]|nr:4-hydroxy-tetrahydrodipicolinate reductase [Candidatus Omnitrophota bacterium]
MVRIIVAGCLGRMGRRIIRLGLEKKNVKVVGVFEHKENPAIGNDIGELIGVGKKGIAVMSTLSQVIDKGDVIIDFTTPSATIDHLKKALRFQKKMVIGTTGLSTKEKETIKKASERIPIVFAPNMSVGVNLLFKLSRLVATTLGDDYDVEIVETHHKHKKDAPSGTAHELARLIAEGRGGDLAKDAVYGRVGMCGERKKGAIGIHAVRGGDVVGEHTVSFMTEGERIELIHRASSRDTLAKGALVAAQFISKKKKGLYSMQDVLGLV